MTPVGGPSPSYFTSLLAAVMLRRPLGAGLTFYADLDVGLLLLAGLSPQSELLQPGAVSRVRPPGLLALELGPALGLSYAVSERWALVAGPQLVWSRRPSPYLTYGSLLRVELSARASVRF